MSSSLQKAYLNPTFSTEQLLTFGIQIAKGLEYMHGKDIAHLHLKSNNVLIDGKKAKLDDWGCSKLKLETASMTENKCSVRWRAPESFTREYSRIKDQPAVKKAADIYAFGILLWEMVAKQIPFAGKRENEVVNLILADEKEVIPANCPPKIACIIEKCWEKRENRPTIDKVKKALLEYATFSHALVLQLIKENGFPKDLWLQLAQFTPALQLNTLD